MNKLVITFAISALAICTFAQGIPQPKAVREADVLESGRRGRMQANPDAKLHRFSTTVERERPQLNQETKDLIAAYRRNPSEENRAALRKQVAKNYDAVVARKKAKLEELKRTAKHQSKIDEMQVIVDEMLRDREQRIESSMARFTDSRFRPGLRDRTDAYLPVLGAKGNNVSVKDAERYCAWLTKNDPAHTYRLPTEAEWELAAGHMPKDADFNCGEGDAIKPVDAYVGTKGACGGYDFWGNCWEMTSTKRGEGSVAVKGGAFDSKRTECRTEARTESRKANTGYPNATFRVVREDR